MSAGVATAFEKEASLVQEHALGTLYERSDGRRYRYVQMEATVGAAGPGIAIAPTLPASSLLANVSGQTTGLTRRGATAITMVPSSRPPTAFPADFFAGGQFVVWEAASSSYRIYQNTRLPIAAEAAQYPTTTFFLEQSDPVLTDIASASFVTAVPSPFARCAPYLAAANDARITGITLVTMPANSYGWAQVSGLGTVKMGAVTIDPNKALYPLATGVLTTVAGVMPPVAVSVGFAQFPDLHVAAWLLIE